MENDSTTHPFKHILKLRMRNSCHTQLRHKRSRNIYNLYVYSLPSSEENAWNQKLKRTHHFRCLLLSTKSAPMKLTILNDLHQNATIVTSDNNTSEEIQLCFRSISEKHTWTTSKNILELIKYREK